MSINKIAPKYQTHPRARLVEDTDVHVSSICHTTINQKRTDISHSNHTNIKYRRIRTGRKLLCEPA